MRKQHGFTLIELIVVIVILGILAMLAIPAYGAVQEKAKVETLKAEMRAQARALVAESALVGPETEVLSLSGVGELPEDYELFKLAADLRLTANATDEVSCEVVVFHTATASDVTCEQVQESIEPGGDGEVIEIPPLGSGSGSVITDELSTFMWRIHEDVSVVTGEEYLNFSVWSPYETAYMEWEQTREGEEPNRADFPSYANINGVDVEYSNDWAMLGMRSAYADWCIAFADETGRSLHAEPSGVLPGTC